jgi:fructose-specific phosphotransferase system IIC component
LESARDGQGDVDQNGDYSQSDQQIAQEQYVSSGTVSEQNHEADERSPDNKRVDRSGFVHGLSVGLGIGCCATFVVVWLTVFFAPLLPHSITYEGLLAIFIYPLVYLLAVGLVALTAGIVQEYYTRKK